jgi:hypothetical protein
MIHATVFYAWENDFSNKNRRLHEFRDHKKYLRWLSATVGLMPWCAGARYPARTKEVEAYDAAMIVTTGARHAPTR